MNVMNPATPSRTWQCLTRGTLAAALCCMLAQASLAQSGTRATRNDTSEDWGEAPREAPADPALTSEFELGPEGDVLAEEGILHDDSQILDGHWHPGLLSADCGYSCPPAWRADVNFFTLNREGNDSRSLSDGFFMPEQGFEEGAKLTLGRFVDCLNGWEITYIGPFEWTEFASAAGAGLNTTLFADPGVDLSAFNNATFHAQLYETEFQSLELNRKWAGWDVIMQTVGIRYMNVDDLLLFRSDGSPDGPGALRVDADNHLLGLQYGIDMIYPLGRWETTSWAKGGIYANFDDASVLVNNAGDVQIANSDDDVDFASLIELGVQLSYRWRPNVSLQAGYQAAWLYGLALAPSQLGLGPLNVNTGNSLDGNDDIWLHGATAGVEIIW